MLEKYQEEVLAAYKKLKYENGAFHNLKNPTPANLRDEAMLLYEKRAEGAEILRLFAKQGTAREGIGKLDIDKFRPVSHFLIDKTSNPNSRVVELVAWLIDFNPRPYDAWREGQKEVNEIGNHPETPEDKKSGHIIMDVSGNTIKSETDIITNIPQPLLGGTLVTRTPKAKSGKKNLVILGLLIVLIAGASYTYWQDRTDRLTISKDEKCMYWTGDHYEAIACNLKAPALKVPLNVEKLNRLKRIDEPNALTKYSLGKVWYAKINGELEYFTDSGQHPVDTAKRLKPLTAYMLNKHVSPDRYLLTQVIWWAGGTIIFMLLAFMIFYVSKKKAGQQKAV